MTATLVSPDTLAALVAGEPAHTVISAVNTIDFFGDGRVKGPADVSALTPTPCPKCRGHGHPIVETATTITVQYKVPCPDCDGTGLVYARLGIGVEQSAIVGTAAVIETSEVIDQDHGLAALDFGDDRQHLLLVLDNGDLLQHVTDEPWAVGLQPGDTLLTLGDFVILWEPVTRAGINKAPLLYTVPLELAAGVLTEVDH